MPARKMKKIARRHKSRKLHVESLEPRVVLSALGAFDSGQWDIDRNDNQTWDGGDQRAYFGIAGDTPAVGDWDGDGRDDLGIFRNGTWFFDLDGKGGAAEQFRVFGIAGDVPVAGDWNGDGIDDVAIFRNGLWFFDLDGKGGAGEKALTFGIAGDVPIAGDWDGDGDDEIGIYRNGAWFFDLDNAGGLAETALAFGIAGDKQVLGDWNGDGRDDLAIVRGNRWFFDLDGSGGAGEFTTLFGGSGSTPLIIGQPPIVDAGAAISGDVGQSLSFAGFVNPRLAESFTVSWDFGDGGTAGNNLNPSHAYSSKGVYTVTLTATNPFGKSFTDTLVARAFKTVNVDAAWFNARGSGPYLLNSSQTKYVLQTDVTVDGTAFVVANEDVVLDLNGHTVTYGNAAPMIVNNGGFEEGTLPTDVPGWDVTQAPGVTRVAARTGMWGNWMLRASNITSFAKIISDPIAIPQANREYTAAISARSSSGSWVRFKVFDAVTGATLGVHDNYAVNRGFANVVTFTPTTTNPVRLLVRMEPPSGGSATFDLDYAAIMPSRDYGVVATQSFWSLPVHLQTSQITSSVSNVKHFTLRNGTLQQGAAAGYASSAVFAQSHNQLTVDAVNMTATGMDTNIIDGPWAANTTVVNSTLQAGIDRISNRMQVYGAIKLFSANGLTRIENNQIIDAPQNGVVVAQANQVEIINNDIRQKAIVTNGYGINAGGKSVTITGNTVIPVQGRGIMLDTASTGNINSGVVANNYVQVYEVPNLEFGRNALEATALRIRVFSSNSIRNLHVHDNTFIARTDDAGVWAAIGLRISQRNAKGFMDGANNRIENNHFKAILETANSANWAHAVSISDVDPGTGLQFSNNIMESNDTSLAFGDNDSFGQNNDEILFLSNTMRKSSDGVARTHHSIVVGWMKNSVQGVQLIDTRFDGGATSSISFKDSLTKEVSVGWLLNVTARDGANAPIAGAQVRVFDKNNTLVYTGSTDGAGKINGIQLISTVLRQTGTNPSNIITDTLTPHRIELIHPSFNTEIRTITLDQTTDLDVAMS